MIDRGTGTREPIPSRAVIAVVLGRRGERGEAVAGTRRAVTSRILWRIAALAATVCTCLLVLVLVPGSMQVVRRPPADWSVSVTRSTPWVRFCRGATPPPTHAQ